MTAARIADRITPALLALSSELLARDIRCRYAVNSLVAFKAVAIARERAE